MRTSVFTLCFVALSACTPATQTMNEVAQVAPVADTTLGVGDTFEVRVFGEPDLSGKFRVGGEGTITFPLAGVIQVLGLEPQQVSQVIADKLREGIMRNPQVTVLVQEQTSKKIYVLGQVAKPGTLAFTPAMTVVEAITGAGGFTPIAARNDTTLTRNEKGKKTITRVPVEEIGKGKERNVYLRPGDIIAVPERIF
jgi:protein involved in polysaccharide export with SLBB domain